MDKPDLEQIKYLSPFKQCGEEALKELISKAKIVAFQDGKMIFKRNEEDPNIYWLLSGSIRLLDKKFTATVLQSNEEAALEPIEMDIPHRLSAISISETRVLIIKRCDLEDALPKEEIIEHTESVNEAADTGLDWMSTLLSSPLFEFIPPANIQTLFGKFDELEYQADDIVIHQGEPGDYFYVIQSGKVKVERSSRGKTSLQAEFEAGDNFGQDALVSDAPRNATVTMTTKGKLMRLSKADFESLLMQPVIETVTLEETKKMIKRRDPKTYIIDVRIPSELENNKISGSINLPLLLLRKNLNKLKTEAIYVCASDGGKRAVLAAYTLNENGFTAYVLNESS